MLQPRTDGILTPTEATAHYHLCTNEFAEAKFEDSGIDHALMSPSSRTTP
jgi:hypothetical protein